MGKCEDCSKEELKLIDNIPRILSFTNQMRGGLVVASFLVGFSFAFTALVWSFANDNNTKTNKEISNIKESESKRHEVLRAYVDGRDSNINEQIEKLSLNVNEIQYNLKSYLSKRKGFRYTEISAIMQPDK